LVIATSASRINRRICAVINRLIVYVLLMVHYSLVRLIVSVLRLYLRLDKHESNSLLFEIFRKLLKINVRGRRFTVNGNFWSDAVSKRSRHQCVCLCYGLITTCSIGSYVEYISKVGNKKIRQCTGTLCLVAETHFLILSLKEHMKCFVQFRL